MSVKLTKRDAARIERLVHRAVCELADASRLLSIGGFTQASRSLDSAAHEAAQALPADLLSLKDTTQ